MLIFDKELKAPPASGHRDPIWHLLCGPTGVPISLEGGPHLPVPISATPRMVLGVLLAESPL